MSQKDTKERGQLYFEILTKSTTTINWLLLTLIIFTGVNYFMLYKWHFGNLKYALKRENYHSQNPKAFESLYKQSFDKGYFTEVGFKDSSEEVQKRFLQSEIKASIKKFETLNNEGLYSTLPFLGISFYTTDYLILLLIIGLILFYWLYRNLKFSRDILKEYFNSPSKLDNTDSELISSLFFFLLPSAEKHKRYKHVEIGLYAYVISILSILLSNFYEFTVEHSYKLGIFSLPGLCEFLPHLVLSNLIIVLCLISSVYLLSKSKLYILDIRNLVILTKWVKRALIPAIYDIFKSKKKRNLKPDENLIEYRRTTDTEYLYLCITTIEENEALNLVEARVNLPESLKLFYLKNPNWIIKVKEFDSYLQRTLTVEEQNMRDYFEKILLDDSYEFGLASKWNLNVR